jgi:hypothetical protein
MSHPKGLPVVVLGVGQIGGVLLDGLQRCGREAVTVRRGESARWGDVGDVEAVMVCVAEDDLDAAVTSVPARVRPRIGLVQNELVPSTWRALGLEAPTVAVVWFEKKAGRDAIALLPTPVAGPAAPTVVEALRAVSLPAEVVDAGAALTRALVAKNLYILVGNLAGLAAARSGLAPGGVDWPTGVTTMGALFADHRGFVRALGAEVLAVDRARMGAADAALVDEDAAWLTVEAAVAADPAHGCRGRTAPARLVRTLVRARAATTPILDAIAGD